MPPQDTETVNDAASRVATSPAASDWLHSQPAGFLIQMTLDWIILRASENVDDFLGESHVTLIDEPFSRFVQAQALHDLRNHFSRLSGSTGIARAYRVRLTDGRPRFDIAFQVSEGRVLLEATPGPEHGFGEAIGSVGGLIDGLAEQRGEALLEAAARRVRALTGHDRCVVACGGGRAESSRDGVSASVSATADLPGIVADTRTDPVPIFPRKPGDRSGTRALLRSPSSESLQRLRDHGIGSTMSLPLASDGVIHCESRSARAPDFELHAAVELFAQMLALRLEIDRLRS